MDKHCHRLCSSYPNKWALNDLDRINEFLTLILILIAAISGRSLSAAGARRAGFRPLVADLFDGADTLALAERAIETCGEPCRSGIEEDRIAGTLAATCR